MTNIKTADDFMFVDGNEYFILNEQEAWVKIISTVNTKIEMMEIVDRLGNQDYATFNFFSKHIYQEPDFNKSGKIVFSETIEQTLLIYMAEHVKGNLFKFIDTNETFFIEAWKYDDGYEDSMIKLSVLLFKRRNKNLRLIDISRRYSKPIEEVFRIKGKSPALNRSIKPIGSLTIYFNEYDEKAYNIWVTQKMPSLKKYINLNYKRLPVIIVFVEFGKRIKMEIFPEIKNYSLQYCISNQNFKVVKFKDDKIMLQDKKKYIAENISLEKITLIKNTARKYIELLREEHHRQKEVNEEMDTKADSKQNNKYNYCFIIDKEKKWKVAKVISIDNELYLEHGKKRELVTQDYIDKNTYDSIDIQKSKKVYFHNCVKDNIGRTKVVVDFQTIFDKNHKTQYTLPLWAYAMPDKETQIKLCLEVIKTTGVNKSTDKRVFINMKHFEYEDDSYCTEVCDFSGKTYKVQNQTPIIRSIKCDANIFNYDLQAEIEEEQYFLAVEQALRPLMEKVRTIVSIDDLWDMQEIHLYPTIRKRPISVKYIDDTGCKKEHRDIIYLSEWSEENINQIEEVIMNELWNIEKKLSIRMISNNSYNHSNIIKQLIEYRNGETPAQKDKELTQVLESIDTSLFRQDSYVENLFLGLVNHVVEVDSEDFIKLNINEDTTKHSCLRELKKEAQTKLQGGVIEIERTSQKKLLYPVYKSNGLKYKITWDQLLYDDTEAIIEDINSSLNINTNYSQTGFIPIQKD